MHRLCLIYIYDLWFIFGGASSPFFCTTWNISFCTIKFIHLVISFTRKNINTHFFLSSFYRSRWMAGGGNIACDLCGKQYGTTSGLRRHRMYNCPLNNEKAPERACTYCSYTSRRPDMLRTHMNRHKNQANFDPDETYTDDYSIFVTSSHWFFHTLTCFFSRYLAFFPRNMYWFSHYWIYIFGLTKEENRIKYHCIGNCWLAFSLNLISTTYSLIMLECSSIDINGQLVGECGMDFAFVWSFSRIFRCEGLLLMFCRLPYCSFRIRTIIFVFAYRIFFFLVIV